MDPKSPFIWSLQTDIVKSTTFLNGRHLLKTNQIILPITCVTDINLLNNVIKYCTYLIHTLLDTMKIVIIIIICKPTKNEPFSCHGHNVRRYENHVHGEYLICGSYVLGCSSSNSQSISNPIPVS